MGQICAENMSENRVMKYAGGIRVCQHEIFHQSFVMCIANNEKLFNFYQAGLEANEQLKDQIHAMKEELSSKNVLHNNQETEIKKLNHEAKSFGVKFEEKCKEVKQLKIEVNVLNQDKNALSVAKK